MLGPDSLITRGIEVLVKLRDEFPGLLDVEVVAFAHPQGGRSVAN